MSDQHEADADLDALLDDIPLEGEQKPPEKPREPEAPRQQQPQQQPGAEKSKTDRASEIDDQIRKVLKRALPNPEAALLMVDILCPGEAIVEMKGDIGLTPRQHFLLASGGILGVALATNPGVMQKLRGGFGPKKPPAPKKPAEPAKPQPQPQPKPVPQLPATTETPAGA
jgi:hypothetical protein